MTKKSLFLITTILIFFLQLSIPQAEEVVKMKGCFFHQITKGDTLFKLARENNARLRDVYSLNELSPDSILSIGQWIKIPLYTLKPKYWAKASWYGDPEKKHDKFHGKTMANGKIMNTYEMVAAHKEYPLGTIIKITNPLNAKSLIVSVEDRGPYIEGRDLDLSWAAASELGLLKKGTGHVHIEPVVEKLYASLK